MSAEIADDDRIEIVAGRHPVVEQTLRDAPFVPNDTRLAPDESIHIITGPNMKRQVHICDRWR